MPLYIEIDKIDKKNWNNLISQFDDATVFQTWSYGISTGNSTSHIVIKKGEEVLACCQTSIRQLPFLNIGIAYITWGPLCIRKGRLFDPDVLFRLMCAIKEEYAIKRGYLLRIWPHATNERKEILKQILESEGFKRDDSRRPYRSLRIDLSPSIDNLRKNLDKEWRRCLRRAEENGLTMIEGTNIELFNTLVKLAKEVEKNKNFTDETDYKIYRRTQIDLPEPLKVKLVVCKAQGEPVCAAGYTAIGDTAIYVLAGTAAKAYGLKATYLVQWRMIQLLKESDVRYFDLGPFNPQRNPGVYHFKKGLAKKGWEEIFLGEYEGCFNRRNRMAKSLLKYVRLLRRVFRPQKSSESTYPNSDSIKQHK